jgi:hypothetical protein
MAVETTRVEGERGVLQVQTVHAVCLTTSLTRELLRRQDWEKKARVTGEGAETAPFLYSSHMHQPSDELQIFQSHPPFCQQPNKTIKDLRCRNCAFRNKLP